MKNEWLEKNKIHIIKEQLLDCKHKADKDVRINEMMYETMWELLASLKEENKKLKEDIKNIDDLLEGEFADNKSWNNWIPKLKSGMQRHLTFRMLQRYLGIKHVYEKQKKENKKLKEELTLLKNLPGNLSTLLLHMIQPQQNQNLKNNDPELKPNEFELDKNGRPTRDIDALDYLDLLNRLIKLEEK